MNFFDQADFEVRCEWGLQGVLQLAPISDVVVIVDVLSLLRQVGLPFAFAIAGLLLLPAGLLYVQALRESS